MNLFLATYITQLKWCGQAGRSPQAFLHRMIDLLCSFQKKDHPIRLNSEFHRDHQFSVQWHHVSFWLFPGLSPTADLEVSSDAAGSVGFGAFYKGL